MRLSALLLALALPLTAYAQGIQLPDFGDPSLAVIGYSEEQRLGSMTFKRLRERGALVDDVQSNEYLSAIGQRLALYADDMPYPLHFAWLRSDAINAFAAPGGYIGVNVGLILATRDEDELAGVLAHEIAHVSQRHLARMMAEAQRMRLPMMAAMIASAALAASAGKAGQAAMAGTLAAGAQNMINFTRANEEEADRFGVQTLSRAGFDPAAMGRFFELLQRQTGGTVNDPMLDYLRTHPRSELRAADTQNRTLPKRSALPRDPLAYELIKARLQVLASSNPTALLQGYSELLKRNTLSSGQRYGYVLALRRAGRYAEAIRELEPLLRQYPERVNLRIEQAELALQNGQAARAWSVFEDTRKLYPDHYALARHYAEALLTQGDARRALDLLEPQLRRRPQDVSLHLLYARAAERTGQRASAYAAMAEGYYLDEQYELAVRQAEQALRESSISAYQQAQVQARLRVYQDAYETEKRRREREQ